MSNGQRNMKTEKYNTCNYIGDIYLCSILCEYFRKTHFKISFRLYEYIIYMMLAIIAIGTTMSMNKRVLTFLFVFCSAINH